MKTIGIIGAMEEEITSIKEKLDIISVKNIIGLDYFTGKLEGKNIVLVRSGIGKVNAAICTQVLIDFYGVDCVINVGVAGAIKKGLKVNDIVIGLDFVHHDFDTSPTGDPLGVIPRMDAEFKADAQLIGYAETAIREVLPDAQVYKGRIATGDQFISSRERRQFIEDHFQAYCTEMEGAAIAQTCVVNRVPFVAVRAISDNAEEEATLSFEAFVHQAARNSSLVVEKMIALI